MVTIIIIRVNLGKSTINQETNDKLNNNPTNKDFIWWVCQFVGLSETNRPTFCKINLVGWLVGCLVGSHAPWFTFICRWTWQRGGWGFIMPRSNTRGNKSSFQVNKYLTLFIVDFVKSWIIKGFLMILERGSSLLRDLGWVLFYFKSFYGFSLIALNLIEF